MSYKFKELDAKEMVTINGGSQSEKAIEAIKDAILNSGIGKFVKRLYGWL